MEVRPHALAAGTVTTLPLPDGSVLEVQLTQSQAHASGNVTLSAHAADRSHGGHALLTIGAEGLFGRIGHTSGQYMILTDATGTWLIRLDDPRLEVDDAHSEPLGEARPLQVAQRGEPGQTAQIDIMFIYTPDMLERYPGTLLETRLDHLVAAANQAMVDSDINAVLRRVHHESVDYPESADARDALLAMRLGLQGEAAGPFTGLNVTRAAHGADLVVLTWPHDIETRGACGIAFFPDFDEDANQYDPSAGAHVTNDGISNWSVCSVNTFIHELGHNLNAQHQRLPGQDEGSNYAFIVEGRFNTVMSAIGSTDINRFMSMPVYSNPDIQCGGQACGSTTPGEEANNAQAVREFAPIIAAYAEQVVPGTATPPGPSFPDSDGDGANDWEDPYPFDPYDGNPPSVPPPPAYTPPPLFDGSEIDHYELLIASSGNDQIHAYRMDGRYAGLAVQVELPPFPDQRPALSEFSRFDVRADGLVYMLASADVRRYDRVRRGLVDVFLDSQPPWGSPGSLFGGFPRSLEFNQEENMLVVLSDPIVQLYSDMGDLMITYALPSVDDPEKPMFEVAMRDLAFDAAGQLYIVEAFTQRILTFAGPNGNYLGDLVGADNGLITDPWSLVVGPDEHFYLANGEADEILRIDAGDGTVTTFVPAGSGGLDFARDLAFGPDGELYVLSRGNNAVIRYSGETGDFIDAFVGPGGTGLDSPESMRFVRRIDNELFSDRFEH